MSLVEVVAGGFKPANYHVVGGWDTYVPGVCPLPPVPNAFDLRKVELYSALLPDERSISLKEGLARLSAKPLILLGGDEFVATIENSHLLPDEWKFPVNGATRRIIFPRQFFLNGEQNRCFPFTCHDVGEWDYGFIGINERLFASDQFAVLPMDITGS